MERNKKTPLLFLLLALLHVCVIRMQDCPSPPNKGLTCYSDFNRSVTCMWNSTYVSDHADSVCTIHAKKDRGRFKYSDTCNMEPVDASRPALKKCYLIFSKDEIFQSFNVLSINLSCNPLKQSWLFSFKPSCHIKLNPPQKPDINFTTVSWFAQVTKRERLVLYRFQLEWKQEDLSWSHPSVQKTSTQCEWHCAVQLDPDLLIQGERYEARIQVQAKDYWAKSTWSEWSPNASWVSLIGRPKPTSDVAGCILGFAAGATVFALFMAVVFLKSNETTWVYMVKKIRGLPPPDPAKSFLQDANFQNWLSPYFTSESMNSFLKPVEIVSVEVASTVDAVASYRPEAALQQKTKSESSCDSTSSSFSNPSYSQLCPPPPPPPPPPPVSSLTAGNLGPCSADTPYGPVGCQGEGKNAEQDRDEVRGDKAEILLLLSKGSDNSEPMPVISDYEKVEKLQVERLRLQSLDSGMCIDEEISQGSSEDADSISVTDEGPEDNEEREGGTGKDLVGFQKLFEGSGGLFGKGSIQVCSDYERVQNLQADGPELPSLDSGVSSGGEEQVSQEESMEDIDKPTESTRLLFPPPSPPSSTLRCFLSSFTPLPLNFCGPALSSAPSAPLPGHILERIVLKSTNRSLEPSGDGYMPVKQGQSEKETDVSSVDLTVQCSVVRAQCHH